VSRLESLGLSYLTAIFGKSCPDLIWTFSHLISPCLCLRQLFLISVLVSSFVPCLRLCLELCALNCTQDVQAMKMLEILW